MKMFMSGLKLKLGQSPLEPRNAIAPVAIGGRAKESHGIWF